MLKAKDIFWKVIKIIYRITPSFRNFNLITKICLTIFIGGLCVDLFYAKINQAIPIIKGILEFSPYTEAENLYKADKLPSALNYINFYESLPGYTPPEQMNELKAKIEHQRSSLSVETLLYHAKQIGKSAIGQESDEMYGAVASTVADFTGIGDVKDLYNEYENYSSGKEVDTLTASLAGFGLVTSLASLTPAVAVTAPLKATVAPIKKSMNTLNKPMRKALTETLAPIGAMIKKSKILDGINVNTFLSKTKLEEFSKVKSKQLEELATGIKKSLSVYGDFGEVAKTNPLLAQKILQASTGMKELREFSKVALKFGKEGNEIVAIGGRNVLEAAVAMEKKGNFNIQELKQSLRYGDNGPKLLGKGMKLEQISDKISKLENSAILMGLFLIQWILSKIPWFVAFVVWIFMIISLIKTWAGKLISPVFA